MWTAVVYTVRRRKRWRRPRRWLPRRAAHYLVIGLAKTIGVGYQPHRGLYPISLFTNRTGWGEPAIRYPKPDWTMKRRNASTQAAKDGPHHLAPVESDVFGKLPNIVAQCCVTKYDDGEPRKPGWITVKTLGAAWCVQVKDPDSGCSMTVTAATLDDALALADVLLGADEAPWEPDPFLRSQEARKKK